jgi:hypothetical protein
LLRVKALQEIGHLLTRPFLRHLDPNADEEDTSIKVGQWRHDMVEAGLCLEEELLGGRLEHSYRSKKDPWNPRKLMLEKVVAGNDRQWFDVKDFAVLRILNLDPSHSELSQFKIKPSKELQQLVPEKIGQKRKKPSFVMFHNEHPTKRLVFTGLGISAIGKA